jgi:hypothetical protein
MTPLVLYLDLGRLPLPSTPGRQSGQTTGCWGFFDALHGNLLRDAPHSISLFYLDYQVGMHFESSPITEDARPPTLTLTRIATAVVLGGRNLIQNAIF